MTVKICAGGKKGRKKKRKEENKKGQPDWIYEKICVVLVFLSVCIIIGMVPTNTLSTLCWYFKWNSYDSVWMMRNKFSLHNAFGRSYLYELFSEKKE